MPQDTLHMLNMRSYLEDSTIPFLNDLFKISSGYLPDSLRMDLTGRLTRNCRFIGGCFADRIIVFLFTLRISLGLLVSQHS